MFGYFKTRQYSAQADIGKSPSGGLPPNAPKFLIIGGQKCGTTALHHYLSLHPQLKAATQKELHFFSLDQKYAKGLDFYYSHFPKVEGNEITFEASPSYLASPVAAARIHAYNPNIKLIALVRHPVERAYSAWNMYKRRYQENRNWFFDAWLKGKNDAGDVVRRKEDSLFDFYRYITDELEHMKTADGSRLEASVIPQGFYHAHLSRYFDLFASSQCLIVENSMLSRDTREVLDKIVGFLGLESCDWPESELMPVFKGEYCRGIDMSAVALLSDIYRSDSERLLALLGESPASSYNWFSVKN